jgi:hypothetical protein
VVEVEVSFRAFELELIPTNSGSNTKKYKVK